MKKPTKKRRETLGDRIRERLNALGLKAGPVSVKAGYSEDLIRNVFKAEAAGRKPNLRGDALHALARELQTSTHYLLTGEHGPDFDDVPDSPAGVSTLRAYRGKVPGAMPVVDVTAGAGGGGIAQPANDEVGGVVFIADAVRGEIILPPFVTSVMTSADQGRVHWLEVRGDSMFPTLSHGEFAAVNTLDFTLGPGGVFALQEVDTGEVIIKRLEYAEGDKTVLQVISDNPKHPDRRESIETIRIIGRIIGKIGRI